MTALVDLSRRNDCVGRQITGQSEPELNDQGHTSDKLRVHTIV